MIYLAESLRKDKRYSNSIYIYTTKEKKKFVLDNGLNYIELPINMGEILGNTITFTTHPFKFLKQQQSNIKYFVSFSEEMKSQIDSLQPNIIVADFTIINMRYLIKGTNIKWITTMPSTTALETKDGIPGYLYGLKYKNNLMYRIRNAIARKIVRITKIVLYQLLKKEIAEIVPKLYGMQGEELIYSTEKILMLGIEELEFPQSFPPYVSFIGNISFNEQLSESFFEKKKAAELSLHILITTGGSLHNEIEELIPKIKLLAEQFPHFLFSITLGDNMKSSFKKSLAKNLRIYGYLPYTQVLNDIDICFHHGGTGITYSCIEFEIPMIVLPQAIDQYDVAVRVKYHELGMIIKKSKVKNLQNVLRKMISSYDYYKNQLVEFNKKRELKKADALFREILEKE